MGTSKDTDPFRADAALVYRALRDSGPASAAVLAERAFPTEFGPDDPVYKSLLKRGVRRVYDSLVWMRHAGVVLTAVPSVDGHTVFHLGRVEGAVSPLRSVPVPRVAREAVEPVTAEVSRDQGTLSDAMDIWHGGS